MTRLEQLTMSWSDHRLSWYIDCEEVTRDQLETIIDDWLILDEGQFDVYPDATTLYVRKFHLNSIYFFSSSKKIVHDRLIFIDELPGGYYRYLVKDEVAKTNTTNHCSMQTPCGWCTNWDKKCDKKIGCGDEKPQRGLRAEGDVYDDNCPMPKGVIRKIIQEVVDYEKAMNQLKEVTKERME